jgi:hypothetical protein
MTNDLRRVVDDIAAQMHKTANEAPFVAGTVALRTWADRLRAALKAEPGTRHISGGVCLSCGRLMETERPKSFDELHDFVQERVNEGESL